MDSGNSGSISSSGEEEYDSHADPSSFLNHPNNINPTTTHFGSQSSLLPSMFDHLSSSIYLSQFQPNPNIPHSLLNLESQGPRSEPSCTHPPPTLPSNNVARNSISKKRSRASRRAPTAVLTTNTTNFKSMVQEFTGIPSPPFSSSYSRRLPKNPLLLNSTPTTTPTTLLHNNNTNINNSQLPPHLSLPNIVQNHSLQTNYTLPPEFGAKSLSMASFVEDGQLNAHLVATNGESGHEHVRSADGCGNGIRDPFGCLDGNYGGNCNLNISASASSTAFKALQNGSPRGQGTVESWICSSHR